MSTQRNGFLQGSTVIVYLLHRGQLLVLRDIQSRSGRPVLSACRRALKASSRSSGSRFAKQDTRSEHWTENYHTIIGPSQMGPYTGPRQSRGSPCQSLRAFGLIFFNAAFFGFRGDGAKAFLSSVDSARDINASRCASTFCRESGPSSFIVRSPCLNVNDARLDLRYSTSIGRAALMRPIAPPIAPAMCRVLR
jgi:hypothetical protein